MYEFANTRRTFGEHSVKHACVNIAFVPSRYRIREARFFVDLTKRTWKITHIAHFLLPVLSLMWCRQN
jgi:hypothetical protein